jgi:hypothetical protein
MTAAEFNEPIIADPPGLMLKDLQDATAHPRIAAQRVGPKPLTRGRPISDQLAANQMIDIGIIICQKADERGTLVFWKHSEGFVGLDRRHNVTNAA